MSVLLCDNVTKTYKHNESIHNFSFNFLDRKIYGILGKKGSGRGTLVRLLSSIVKPNSGTIWVDGKRFTKHNAIRSRVCYIKKKKRYPFFYKVNTILKLMNRKYPKWDSYYAYTLCSHFKINASDSYGSLEENKKNILNAICALASRANITIYEDPLFDADIKDRYDFFNFLYKHHQRYPRTVIITSDHIDEINYLFDKVLFLYDGKLIEYFTSKELSTNFKYLTGKTEVLKSLIKGIKIIGTEERNGILTVCVRKDISKDERRKFIKYLIEVSDVPIEKVFIYLINIREYRNKKNDIL